MKVKEKPKYNTLQNVWWMIKIAYRDVEKMSRNIYNICDIWWEVVLGIVDI